MKAAGAGAPVGARGHQGVARQRRDLEEDVEVEDVAGDDDAQHSRQREQDQGEEQPPRARRDLRVDGAPGRRRDERGHAGDQHEEERVEGIDGVADPQGRRPAAHVVRDRPVVENAAEQRQRDGEGGPGGQNRDEPGDPRPGDRGAQRRGEQGDRHLERGQMLDERHGRQVVSRSRISSSSIEPWVSPMRTMSARASAVVATDTTMAVRIRTCGSGLE